ncbi:hypothetical protein HanLR1_Chr13g0506301 [Helianthus annuus]|nr:hypothetical protein HanLR1_Chr13g0506301 [Helianthus annuus]
MSYSNKLIHCLALFLKKIALNQTTMSIYHISYPRLDINQITLLDDTFCSNSSR